VGPVSCEVNCPCWNSAGDGERSRMNPRDGKQQEGHTAGGRERAGLTRSGALAATCSESRGKGDGDPGHEQTQGQWNSLSA